MTDSEDAELLQVFLDETREHLDGIEGDLLSLESDTVLNVELVNKIFRAIHSVKGGAGFFGLVAIKQLSHAMENVLGLMQKQKLAPSPEVVAVLLRAADSLVYMISDPSQSSERDISQLLTELEDCERGTSIERPAPSAATPSTEADTAPNQSESAIQQSEASSIESRHRASYEAHAPAKSGTVSQKKPPLLASTETSIRVHVGILDRLMTLAGELVLTRNQLLQSHNQHAESNAEATQRIDHITTELQDAIMSTRMQSIGLVFQKFRRVVRDLASSLGKEVELVLEGEDVELDRSIIEAIGDPLTHLVRNALDHGIERPAVRRAQNKPSCGRLRLSAFHKAGQVIIEIADDGAGIDSARVRAKAIERGICTAEQLAGMSENAVIKLIFRPGFSTATEVTEISGRGVGMDVVHSNLSRLGGVVDVQSQLGAGTVMRIKLPLTLAIIPCLLVTEEAESFAIPQASLIELHRLPAAEVKNQIKKFGNVLVLRLRGELIPLVRLRDALNMPSRTFAANDESRHDDRRETGYDRRQAPPDEDSAMRRDRRMSAGSSVNVAIVASGDFRYGIMVESLQDSLEIVVKPLGRHLRHCDSYAGATILGDGRLALILDVVSIGRRLQFADASDALAAAKLAQPKPQDTNDRMTLLLVESSGQEQLAIPLGLVLRIERIDAQSIQHVGGKRTLTYRGKNLPLFAIDDAVRVAPCRVQPSLYAIVFRSHDREVALLVSDLLDIIDSNAELDELTHRQSGVFGSLLVENKVTLLLDVHGIARICLGLPDTAESSPKERKHTVLVVEDSRFFRDRIAEFNREAGHNVLTATDGLEGWSLLDKNAKSIDLVLTDIEMPNLDGFEFTKKLRADPRFATLPVIAVTSLMGEEAEQRGRQVGITEYLVKLDRERIMDRVSSLLREPQESRHWGNP